jgi:hypothetical protein
MAYTTIDKSTDYYSTKKYSGTGSAQSITGVGFQPDWCWIKNASSGSNYSHQLYDATRGVTKYLQSNSSASETTEAQGLTAFDSDGFSVGTNAGANSNGSTLISWNWKANGQGSSNGDGSITTTYTSANTTSGFSICKWTGTGSNATIGHGLGVAPKMIIVKNISTSDSWNVYHESIGNGKRLFLDTTGGESSTSDAWNSTSPTTSVFSIGTNTGTNGSGNTLIAYCFAEKIGFSKFNSYVGNGNANGPFVYCGFRPAFVMFKESDGAGANWTIQDNKREGFNLQNRRLFPNDSSAENTTSFRIDMFANGFRLNNSDTDSNASSTNYIFAAFAEAPLVGSNDIAANAR